MRTKLRGIVLVSLLAAGCHSLPLLSDGSRIPKLEAGKVSASNSDQSSQHVDSQRVDKTSIKAAAPTRHDSTEDNASLTAPPPASRAADSVRTPVAVAAAVSVDVDELLRLARSEVGQRRFDPAKAYYQQILAREPDYALAHQGLGNIADVEQNFRSAEDHYRAALRRTPANADLLSDLGYSYLLQGKLRECEGVLQQALGIRPDHQRALNNLGLLCIARCDADGAFDAFRRSVGEDAARERLAQLLPNGRPVAAVSGIPYATAMNAGTVMYSDTALNTVGQQDSSGARTAPGTVSVSPPSSFARPSHDSQTIIPMGAEVDVSNGPTSDMPRNSARSFQPAQFAPSRRFSVASQTEDDAALANIPYWPPRKASPGAMPRPARPGDLETRAQTEGADGTGQPADSTGNLLEDDGSRRDPLAEFEAEIRKRSRADYSVERSFRTGAPTTVPSPTSPQSDPLSFER